MARAKKTNRTQSKKATTKPTSRTYSLGDRLNLQSLQADWEKSTKNFGQNSFSLVLGALIVIVLAVLVFNYFNKPQANPETSSSATQSSPAPDVTKENLPGKYTVKGGDTLFNIAQKYYDDGYLFPKIAEANNLADVNNLEVGQVLEIPKIATSAMATPTPTPSQTPTSTETPTSTMTPSGSGQTAMNQQVQPVQGGTGGPANMTAWGDAITGTTYTVQEGDWLSKIAGRAYGDIFAFSKIAQANHIPNPDHIEPGMVITIPR